MIHETGNRDYTLTKDASDQLRTDVSDTSLQEQKIVNELAMQIRGTILSEFSLFIPATQSSHNSLEDRIFVVHGKQEVANLAESWGNKKVGIRINGFHDRRGRIIALPRPEAYWEDQSEEVKKLAIEREGSLEKAQKVTGNIMMENTLVHEIIHDFANHSSPNWFEECGTYYYQALIRKKLGMGHIFIPIEKARADFYQKLKSQYDNDVDKLFFGTSNDDTKNKQIIDSILPTDLDYLFPRKHK